MGLDLTLLPLDVLNYDTISGLPFGYSRTMLTLPSFPRKPDGRTTYDLHDAIYDLKPEELPRGHQLSGITCETGTAMYNTFGRDAKGKPYTWITAGKLATVLRDWIPGRPVTEFVLHMREDDRIVLGWC
jgi:hypothetical protein